jgi:hypothetical protein
MTSVHADRRVARVVDRRVARDRRRDGRATGIGAAPARKKLRFSLPELRCYQRFQASALFSSQDGFGSFGSTSTNSRTLAIGNLLLIGSQGFDLFSL